MHPSKLINYDTIRMTTVHETISFLKIKIKKPSTILEHSEGFYSISFRSSFGTIRREIALGRTLFFRQDLLAS
jgi:hypothetical protein